MTDLIDKIERLSHENDCLQATIAQIDYPCSPHCHGYLREQKLLRDALRAQQHAEAQAEALEWAIPFIEALADNDLDDPIDDNGMTVGAMLQMDAPPLTFKLRAALAAYRSVKP